MSKTCYALYQYETLPSSEWPDWYVRVYLDKDEALAAMTDANKQAYFDMDAGMEQPDFLYEIKELPLYCSFFMNTIGK